MTVDSSFTAKKVAAVVPMMTLLAPKKYLGRKQNNQGVDVKTEERQKSKTRERRTEVCVSVWEWEGEGGGGGGGHEASCFFPEVH
jgi:hypothetical protein